MFSLYGQIQITLHHSLGIALLSKGSTDTNRLDQHELLHATAVVD